MFGDRNQSVALCRASALIHCMLLNPSHHRVRCNAWNTAQELKAATTSAMIHKILFVSLIISVQKSAFNAISLFQLCFCFLSCAELSVSVCPNCTSGDVSCFADECFVPNAR